MADKRKLEELQRMLEEHLKELMGEGKKTSRDNSASEDSTPSNVKSFLKAAAAGDRRRCQSFMENGGNPNVCGLKGITALHLAAHESQLVIVKELLKLGADINATDEDGDTPLITAVINRKEEAVELLIEKGANVRHVNNKGHTAADVALMKRSLTIVAALENKARCLQFDSTVHEKTLMTAAQEGNTRIIDFWLKNHSDRRAYNHKLGHGRTLAFIAALNGHLDIVELLDTKGADFELPDEHGHTPMFCAAQNDHFEVVQFLLKKGCNVNHQSLTGRTPIFSAVNNGHDDIVRLLIRNGANVNQADEEGTTPLECAIKQGSMPIFHMLIDKGARVNHIEFNGYDLAMIAASNQQLDMLKELHVLGVSMNQVNKKNGETALLGACQVGPEESVGFLITEGRSDMNHRNKRGVSPALRAAYNGHFVILMALGESGAELDLPNKGNETAILCAAQKGSVDMVKYLHSKKCNISVKDDNGRTLAWHAAKEDNVELLEYLSGAGAPLDVPDKDGNTPLMQAVKADANADTVRFLMNAGCSLGKQNQKGETAVDIAKSRKREELLKVLQAQKSRAVRRVEDLETPKRDRQREQPQRDRRQPKSSGAAAGGAAGSSGLDPNFNTWNIICDEGDKKKPIGVGGFGKVYKAYTDKHQFVAVKIVKLRGANDAKRLEKAIEQERKGVEVLKSIQHQNIVVFLKTERYENGQFCIFTELIAGISLFDLMKKQKKPFDEFGVKKFSMQICTALNFLHRRRPAILHRDIKCSNIMLTHEGIIKLIDFGLAKEIVTTTIAYTSIHQCGTPYFMAPELFSEEGHASYTPQSDVWAFGCTVFEMTTMEPPNRCIPVMLIPGHIRSKKMPLLAENFSSDLRDFYRCCVVKDSDMRPDTTDLLDHDFLA